MTGTIPDNQSSFLVKASLPDPSGTLSVLLKNKLEFRNIKVRGRTKVISQLPLDLKELLVLILDIEIKVYLPIINLFAIYF